MVLSCGIGIVVYLLFELFQMLAVGCAAQLPLTGKGIEMTELKFFDNLFRAEKHRVRIGVGHNRNAGD